MSPSGAHLVWLRRDLRTTDHAALAAAIAAAHRERTQVYCAFVFDREILDPLASRRDRRVQFIHAALAEIDATLKAAGGGLIVIHGHARREIPALAQALSVSQVHAAIDYEPAARERDEAVAQALRGQGRTLVLHKDQVIRHCSELLTGAGQPYGVFTPYRNAWMKRLSPEDWRAHPVVLQAGMLASVPTGHELPALADLGFEASDLARLRIACGPSGAQATLQDFLGRIDGYAAARDYPAVRGPSYLSVHLRFGTISVRELVRAALERGAGTPPVASAGSARGAAAEGARTWLNELIWREFYFQVLWHHPRVVEQAFRPAFDRIQWSDDQALFQAWCEARTGYPLVDAAMAQLNHSGYMHNRLRMVTASFLTKDLGIDWRWGERYFAQHLNDFDLAANNGGWQWAASSGCDAQPWFRIFNPVRQSEKFDPQGKFIRRYLPQLAALPDALIHSPWLATGEQLEKAGVRLGVDYPHPIVDHDAARALTLTRYAVVKGDAAGA
jgi:deoxyribodipyrimidine photo-lyase